MTCLPGYIDGKELKGLLEHQGARIAIIDVRDEDFEGGHIRGAKQFPSYKFEQESEIDALIASLPPDTEQVVVHCMLSQIRGPKSARRLSERFRNEKWRSHPNRPQIKILRHGYEGFSNQYLKSAPELFEDVEPA